MALSFTRLSWWWLGGKEKEQVPNGSVINSINSLGEWGLGLRGEPESLKFQSVNGGGRKMAHSSSNRKSKRKWKSREERSRMIDKEYDVVLVPSDGVCLSGTESEDSDWSIGWMEPHAPISRVMMMEMIVLLCWWLAIGIIARNWMRRMRRSLVFRHFQMVILMGEGNTWNSGFPLSRNFEPPVA